MYQHLINQLNAALTFSMYQPEFEAKLSGYHFNFKFMEASCQYLKFWKNAFDNYNIALHRGQVRNKGEGYYYAKLLEANERDDGRANPVCSILPSVVLNCAKLNKIWCIPEWRTHEEAVGVLTHEHGRGRKSVTSHELQALMDNWVATFYDLGDRSVEDKTVLSKVRGYMKKTHKDEGRSMETLEDVCNWMTAFVYVFELKDGLLSEVISAKIQKIYKGMSNVGLEGGYTKKIYGCSCSLWMRYCVCVHSWAHMIIWKVQ
jgi:hypothetical protein